MGPSLGSLRTTALGFPTLTEAVPWDGFPPPQHNINMSFTEVGGNRLFFSFWRLWSFSQLESGIFLQKINYKLSLLTSVLDGWYRWYNISRSYHTHCSCTPLNNKNQIKLFYFYHRFQGCLFTKMRCAEKDVMCFYFMIISQK